MRRVALFAASLLFYASMAQAQVPHLVRYQGFLKDSQNTPLEGPYNLTFRLYPVATAGTALWTETQANISISAGSFSVLLGQVTSLDTVDWGTPLWLSVQVNTDPELLPRQQITSAPLAIRAETAEIVKTSGLTDDAHSLVPTGAVLIWTGASCPTGYSRLSTLDGKFLVSDAAFNAAAGGSNTKDISHTHDAGSYAAASHTHGAGSYAVAPTTTNGGGCCAGGLSNPPSTTPISGTSGASGLVPVSGTSSIGGSTSLDIRPAFATVLLCQKN